MEWDWRGEELPAAQRKTLEAEFMAEDAQCVQHGCEATGCTCDIAKVKPHTHATDEFHVRLVTLPDGRQTYVTAWVHCTYESWIGECKPA